MRGATSHAPTPRALSIEANFWGALGWLNLGSRSDRKHSLRLLTRITSLSAGKLPSVLNWDVQFYRADRLVVRPVASYAPAFSSHLAKARVKNARRSCCRCKSIFSAVCAREKEWEAGSGASLLIQKPSALISHPQLWSLLWALQRARGEISLPSYYPSAWIHIPQCLFILSRAHTPTFLDAAYERCCADNYTTLVSNWVRNTFHVSKAYIYRLYYGFLPSGCFPPPT